MKLSHWSGLKLKDRRSRSTSSSVGLVSVVGVICLPIVSITGSAFSVVTGVMMGGVELVESSFDAVDAVGGSAMEIVGFLPAPAVSRFVVVAVGLKMELPIWNYVNQ